MGMHLNLRLRVRRRRGRGKGRVGVRCGERQGGGYALCGVDRRFLRA